MKKIQAKLFEIQKKNISVSKDGENSFFKNAKGKPSKYTTLENLMKVLYPVLLEFNLLLYHKCEGGYLKSIVVDMDSDSGESEVSEFQLTNTDPQKQGAAITYAKRYNISALFNITTEKDDDGNKASSVILEKKTYNDKQLSLFKGRCTGKRKEEVMQKVLQVKKEYIITEEIQKEIDLFLTTLS